jgi:hypothetical protein
MIHQHHQTMKRLLGEQWQALIALHRTLLYEHHLESSLEGHPIFGARAAIPNWKRIGDA